MILVFDAYKVKAGIGSSHKEGTIHVVYTKQAQTADMDIEQATHQLASEFHVTVATSDGMEQLIASGQGGIPYVIPPAVCRGIAHEEHLGKGI